MTGAQTTPGVLRSAIARFGNADAIVDGGTPISYTELGERVSAAAGAMVAAGLATGDAFSVWAPNGADWIIAALGGQAAGGVLVPINTRMKGAEAGYILRRARSRLLFVANGFLDQDFRGLLAGEDLPDLRRIVSFGSEWQDFLAEASEDDRQEAARREQALAPDDLSDIMFTSGTTGDPKGVMSSHGQNCRISGIWAGTVGLQAGDRYLMLWPFFHCGGYKSGWLPCLIAGTAIHPALTLDVDCLLDRVENEAITVFPGPPTMFQTMLDSPRFKPGLFSRIRLAVTGASTVPPSLIHAMRDDLGIRQVLTGYGLTETCGTVTLTDANDPPEVIVESPGRAIPDMEIEIRDGEGRPVPRGETGEICVRGPNVMRGYLDDPEATAEAIDSEGWLRTGDVGTLDNDGYLRITDRLKDMFIVGGFNCYPAEIEKIMSRHPGILAVAVIGVPEPRLGEVGKAYVVPASGADLTEESVVRWCRDNMANYKVPRFVEVVDALPLNAMAKVVKTQLRR